MAIETNDVIDISGLRLTEDQRAAVEFEGGPMIVLAGPGTGKTRVITARVAHMIAERGIEPDQIVAVTFTNKAAGELGERLGEIVGQTNAAQVVSSTFHSLGLGIVRRYSDVLGLPRDPVLIDSAQRRGLIREIIRDHKLYRYAMGSGIESAIEIATKTMEGLRHLGYRSEGASDWLGRQREGLGALEAGEADSMGAQLDRFEQAVRVYGHFERGCLERGWLVFDDLIMLPSKLMKERPEIAGILRQDHRHVVVDEFQDVNAAQIEMIRQLCPPESNPDLCVVGDDDQSIYGFRGADDQAFAHFAQIWNAPKTITLSTNFRSASAIVDASNEVIDRAHVRFDDTKVAESHAGEVAGAGVELVKLEGDPQSGEVIAAMLLKMMSDARLAGEEFSFDSCAVIARSKNELAGIARVLMLEGIPVQMNESSSPMDDEGVQDVIAWARLLVDPCSVSDVRRILVRPPMRCEAIGLGGLITQWRVVRSRWLEGEEGAEDPGELVGWLSTHATGEMLSRIQKMQTLAVELGAIASQAPAGETVMEIIKRTGVVHGELGNSRQRASRVSALVALVKFARSRGDRFEEPGDVAAMLRYWEDLDPGEKTLGQLPEHVVEDAGAASDVGGDGGDVGAVAMLTAHASKGLEYETVFVPRVSAPHGFPMTSRSNQEVLPEWLVCRGDDVRDKDARQIDEERRVFYVALTRAHNRVVLLAKVPKNPKAVNFVIELRQALGEKLVERDAGDVLDPASGNDAVSRLGIEFKAANRVRDVFDEAKRGIRRQTAMAIDAMELGEIDRAQLAASLADACDRSAVLRGVLENGEVPQWVEDREIRSFGDRLVDAMNQEEAQVEDGRLHPGLRGPLKLSFTQISGYLFCPRCYLVERVLKLDVDQGTAAVVGKAVHEALERFYQRWRVADAEGGAMPGWEMLEELTRAYFFAHWPIGEEIDTKMLEQTIAMMENYWESMHDESAHIEELEKTMSLPYEHEGVTHQITAVLDRVDATESGGRRVIDYKTGKPRDVLVDPKDNDLQLGIYAMALEHAYGDPGPGSSCEYWLLQTGEKGKVAMDTLNMKKIHAKIDKAISGMLAGEWEQSGDCKRRQSVSACSILDHIDDRTRAEIESRKKV